MDGPKTVIAAWKSEKQSDYTYLLAVVGLGVCGIAGAYLFITRRKKPHPIVDDAVKSAAGVPHT
jgi:hypothetical protein